MSGPGLQPVPMPDFMALMQPQSVLMSETPDTTKSHKKGLAPPHWLKHQGELVLLLTDRSTQKSILGSIIELTLFSG